MNNFIKTLTEELAFSNWEYSIPEDPEKILYDFYFFSLFAGKADTGNKKLDFALEEAVKKATNSLYKHMLKALKWAISGELRHIFYESRFNNNFGKDALRKETIEFLETFEKFYNKDRKSKVGVNARVKGIIKKESPGDRMNSYKAISSAIKEDGISNHDFSKIAEDAFLNLIWHTAYGGKAWASIAKGYQSLLTAKNTKEKIKWIDHAYDLQHNNATVFEKVKKYYKEGDDYFQWITNALDWKRDIQDVRGYYSKVSTQLKPIVAYVAKNVFGKEGIDKYEKIYGKNDVWDGGVWKDGVWNGGTWKKGTWNKGHWKGGHWQGGTWKTGYWENGTWNDGTWLSGTWEDGYWNYGKWKDGWWEKGTWKFGEIWDPKKKEYRYSEKSPNKCKWSLSYDV